MTDPIMEEVYRARELLWERGGGTMRGVVEYLKKREAERLAGVGRVADSTGDEAWKTAAVAGEPEGEYRAAGKKLTLRHRGAEGSTKGQKREGSGGRHGTRRVRRS